MKIVHNIYDTLDGFRHSVSVDGVESDKVGYRDIARIEIGNTTYCASTDFYDDELPRVFKIESVESSTNER